MRTLIAHLQKYYGVYLLVIAVLFLILWFPNRAVNRYAIVRKAEDGSVLIIDTRTGQEGPQNRKREELIKRYADEWRSAIASGDRAKESKVRHEIADDIGKNLYEEDIQTIFDRVTNGTK